MLNECVIIGKRIDRGDAPPLVILGKNRDRNYRPKLFVYYIRRNNLDIVLLYDARTGWCEGMNSNGIGIVNTALSVQRDEAEGHSNRIKKDLKKNRTLDGAKVFRALQYSTIAPAVKSIALYEGGLAGHTIIGNGDGRMYTVELGEDVSPIATTLKSPWVVRTNHGERNTSLGYTAGEDFISSRMRKKLVVSKVKDAANVDDIVMALSQRPNEAWQNPFREAPAKMRTTSQLILDLTNLTFTLRIVEKYVTFNGIRTKGTPLGSINIKVERIQ